MTVNDLRKFNPRVTEDNEVPTVNHDMEAEMRVMDHAPLTHLDEGFETEEMRVIDHILAHLGEVRNVFLLARARGPRGGEGGIHKKMTSAPPI